MIIPKRPHGLKREHDSLATLAAKVRWLRAVARVKADRYLVEHYGAARLVIGVLLLLVMLPIAYKIDGVLAGYYVPVADTHGPQVSRAWVQFVYYLVVIIVSALISMALAPKPPTPEVGKPSVPVADDGKAIERIYGTVWLDDPMVLGFKTMGADPIKAKGGKK